MRRLGPRLDLKMNEERDDFQVEDFRIYDSKTRGFLVRFIVIMATIFLLGAAAYGFYTGEFGVLSAVVMAVEAHVFMILGYYFGQR